MPQQLPAQLLRTVETLDEDQLHILYHVVAERLRLAQMARTLYAMSNFHVLDRVSFSHNGKYYEGVVTRLNQKTVAVTLDDGSRWNVAPGFLTKRDDTTAQPLRLLPTEEKGQ